MESFQKRERERRKREKRHAKLVRRQQRSETKPDVGGLVTDRIESSPAGAPHPESSPTTLPPQPPRQ